MGLTLLTASAGCGADEVDALDRELIRELARATGTASGTARSGDFRLATTTDSCDCPSVEIEDQTLDLCVVATTYGLPVQSFESGGMLAIADKGEPKMLMLTGAIEADGRFSITESRNLATLAGPFEALRRMDGQFVDDDSAEGWMGQRLVGAILSVNVDCRWNGSFAITRE